MGREARLRSWAKTRSRCNFGLYEANDAVVLSGSAEIALAETLVYGLAITTPRPR